MTRACVCPLGTRQPAEGRSACSYCGGRLAARATTREIENSPTYEMSRAHVWRGDLGTPDGTWTYSHGTNGIATKDEPKAPYVTCLLALVDTLVASGVTPKVVRCGFLLFADCRDRVGARVEIGASSFERNGVKWIYDPDFGAHGVAIT